VRTAAEAARTDADVDDAEAAAGRLRRQHEAEQDREYVVHQTRVALAELGYEVGEEFESVAVAGGPAVVTRADLPDHGLQLRFLPGSQRLLSNVVAFGDTSAVRDEEVEDITCHDIEALQEAWRREGIEGEFRHRQAPGAVRVERVSRPRTTSRTTGRERSL
jgi:hypothetical protein